MRVSALGQKRTLRSAIAMSALPPIADMCTATRHVRFVPKADIREMSFGKMETPPRGGVTEIQSTLCQKKVIKFNRRRDDHGGNNRGQQSTPQIAFVFRLPLPFLGKFSREFSRQQQDCRRHQT